VRQPAPNRNVLQAGIFTLEAGCREDATVSAAHGTQTDTTQLSGRFAYSWFKAVKELHEAGKVPAKLLA
jgi:hypothetical protein